MHTLEQLKERKIRKFLHFSTVLIYDEKRITLPVSENAPMIRTRTATSAANISRRKRAGSTAMGPYHHVRLSNIYGPTPLQRFDLDSCTHPSAAERRAWRSLEHQTERDFIYVDDAAQAIARLLDADYDGTLNLGTGISTPVSTVVDLLRELSGCPIVDRDIPVKGPAKFRCDMSTLHKLIDWSPRYSIEDGVRTTWETMRAWKSS